jgi:two-component system sensor histidine kinase QseC
VLGSGERGSGLGWSIMQRIGHAQGATISAAPSSALGGLQVQVVWPA